MFGVNLKIFVQNDTFVTNPGGREDWFRLRPTTTLFVISLTNHKHSPLTFNGLLTYNYNHCHQLQFSLYSWGVAAQCRRRLPGPKPTL